MTEVNRSVKLNGREWAGRVFTALCLTEIQIKITGNVRMFRNAY